MPYSNTTTPMRNRAELPVSVEPSLDHANPDASFNAESAPRSLRDKESTVGNTSSNDPQTGIVVEYDHDSACNVRPQVQAPSANSPVLPSPGLALPPAIVPQLFYETVRNAQPPVSCLTPSSTGATRGVNSYADTRDVSTPLTPMSAPRGTRGADAPQSAVSSADVSPTSAQPRQAASYGSFQQQSFSSASFYPARSASMSEPPYPASGTYPQHPPPGPGFLGQYMSTQPPHSMPVQSFGYSQPFAHPGIPAADPSAMGLHFGVSPSSMGRGFGYQLHSGSDVLVGEAHDARSVQGYGLAPHMPFAPSSTGSHPAPASTTPDQHVTHQPYAPPHFSPQPSTPHYPGYPAGSYARSSPGGYAYVPGPYQQPYYTPPPASPEDLSNPAAWWYVAPGPGGGQQYESSPYRGGYYQPPMRMNRPEYDPYSSLGSGSPSNPFPGPSGQPHALQQRMTRVPPREPAPMPSSPVAPPPGPSTTGPGAGAGPGAAPLPQPAPDVTPPRRKADTPGLPAAPSATSRRYYHPNPPANRSDWVMWVGNVPSDAKFDELWHFFNQPAPTQSLSSGTSAIMSSRHVHAPSPEKDKGRVDVWGGVSSLFLITRSNCAFVNFETERHLECGVTHFNGKSVRPKDPRCPRLVCRVRRRDDDLKAGVGGQRGMGLHTRWVAEQKEREQGREWERELKARQGGRAHEGGAAEAEQDNIDGPPTSPSTYLAPSSSSDPSPPIPAVSPLEDIQPVPSSPAKGSPDDKDTPRHSSSGDRSFASTNSSFLAAHFPQRYFILKSLTQHDLNLSLERGVWATQPHNEAILDQAYRTSADVYLVFGVNKSGEFFGYARMAGPVFHGDRVDHVSWASRSSTTSSAVHRGSSPPELIEEEDESDKGFLSPSENRMVGESPAPVTPGQEARLQAATSSHADRLNVGLPSAPAEPHQPHLRISRPTLPREAGTYPERHQKASEKFHLPEALSRGSQIALRLPPRRAAAAASAADTNAGESFPSKDADGIFRMDTYGSNSELRRLYRTEAAPGITRTPVSESGLERKKFTEDRRQGKREAKSEGWGREFKIEWLRTERLAFHRTRNLRNPWNHDREVKVSRDGTEVEPSVGQKLLEEWDMRPSMLETSPPASPPGRGRGSKSSVKAGHSLPSQVNRPGVLAGVGRGEQ